MRGRHVDADGMGRGQAVVGGWSAVSQHALINAVDAAASPLGQPNAFDDVGQQRVAGSGWGYQQIIQIDSLDKPPWTADVQALIIQFDVDRAQGAVVTVDQGVDKGFPEGSPVEIRDGHPEQSDVDLFFLDSGPEQYVAFFECLQQGFAEELVDQHIGPSEYLKRDFMGWKMLAQLHGIAQ